MTTLSFQWIVVQFVFFLSLHGVCDVLLSGRVAVWVLAISRVFLFLFFVSLSFHIAVVVFCQLCFSSLDIKAMFLISPIGCKIYDVCNNVISIKDFMFYKDNLRSLLYKCHTMLQLFSFMMFKYINFILHGFCPRNCMYLKLKQQPAQVFRVRIC